MGTFHCLILELCHGTHLKPGFLPESSPRTEQPVPVVNFYHHHRIQDSTTDFSRQNCGQITRQISRVEATASGRFGRLFRYFIY